MGFNIRFPQINAKTEAEKQISSYLFQLAEQLQWALQNVETSNNTASIAPITQYVYSDTPSLTALDDTGTSATATFESIKDLIIKSADIVNAYYEEINKRLVGEYVAQSDFGVFEEQTSQDIFENSTNINRTFNHAQEIKTGVEASLKTLSGEVGKVDSKVSDAEKKLSGDIESINKSLTSLSYSLVEVTANLKTGLLYYNDDGVPVYGLEVGQTNTVDGEKVFNKFARFTADRLSFYDQNGAEVAYISDRRLYIYNVEITGIYKIGGLVATVMASGDVVEKWVGRG